jgi:hypothetical protein
MCVKSSVHACQVVSWTDWGLFGCLQIIEDAALHDQYCRVITPEPAINEETEEVCALLKQCHDLR